MTISLTNSGVDLFYTSNDEVLGNTHTDNPILQSSVPTTRRFTLQFTNNAMVYYKSHSLSIGGGSVRNARHKKRKT